MVLSEGNGTGFAVYEIERREAGAGDCSGFSILNIVILQKQGYAIRKRNR